MNVTVERMLEITFWSLCFAQFQFFFCPLKTSFWTKVCLKIIFFCKACVPLVKAIDCNILWWSVVQARGPCPDTIGDVIIHTTFEGSKKMAGQLFGNQLWIESIVILGISGIVHVKKRETWNCWMQKTDDFCHNYNWQFRWIYLFAYRDIISSNNGYCY